MLDNLGKLLSSGPVQRNWKEGEDVYVDDEEEDDDDECILISHDTWHLHRYCCQRGWPVGRVLRIGRYLQ